MNFFALPATVLAPVPAGLGCRAFGGRKEVLV